MISFIVIIKLRFHKVQNGRSTTVTYCIRKREGIRSMCEFK